jgi:PBP1b-binding outer membrane lipoprotein LpoB
MQNAARIVSILSAALVLAACSSEPPPPREEDKALQRAIQEPIDKAKAAREAAEAAAKQRDQQIKDQE